MEVDSPIGNILEALLVEILSRVPTTQSVFICRSVCKQWYFLTKTPYFVRYFVSHHLNYLNRNDKIVNTISSLMNYQDHPYAIIFCYCNSQRNHTIFTISDKPTLQSRVGLLVANLPEENKQSVGIVASFNDLILFHCRKRGMSPFSYNYYISNPFTMQWIALPPIIQKHTGPCKLGFVCEPYCCTDNSENCIINNEYRYRVLRLTDMSHSSFFLDIYCSETGKWDESYVSGDQYRTVTNIVPYNGKLYWYSVTNIVAFDPFDAKLSRFFDGSTFRLGPPVDNNRIREFFHMGICQGCLRLMRLVIGGRPGIGYSNALTLWELKDDIKGEWTIEQQVSFDTMVSKNHFVHEFIRGTMISALALGFHPIDGGIVYLQFQELVILCNMRTRELDVVSKTPAESFLIGSGIVFPVVLPLWPTPICAIP